MPHRGVATRLIAFYVILAALTVAVVVVVVHKGQDEQPAPLIAGGYDASAPNPCLGPPPIKWPGAPLPATTPGQPIPAGPSFNLVQSGQFVNIQNNAQTLGGQLRLNKTTLAGGGHQLTGTVDCVSGGNSSTLDAIVVPGAKGSITGKLGGVPLAAAFKRDPPDPGTPNPRTPPNIDGLYSASPRSTCLGTKFVLTGSGSTYKLSAKSEPLGTVLYSSKTGGLAGDVSCLRGGKARLRATANDLMLTSMQLIPLDVATPLPLTPAAKAAGG